MTPDFDHLPSVAGMPQGCAWGVFDQNDQKDRLGTLNWLTPAVVQQAATEVRQGISISLNIAIPNFFRKTLSHRVLELKDPQSVCYGFDDEVALNTQSGSQWDSLCHFLHQPTGLAYNGLRPTVENLEDPEQAVHLPTIDHWHERGCMAGRGVLIDFKRYADIHGITYSVFSDFRISPDDIEAVARDQGLQFRPGDILLLRFGFTEALASMTGDEQAASLASHRVCGVEGSKAMARWLWNHQFVAVASDTLAVEAMPPMENGQEEQPWKLVLHQWCLSLMGMPLGELWDLHQLSQACHEAQRYSFFLTSSPLNVPGGVGSPPNAMAIL
ncbi:uncharacterized protein ATNIH1004_005467 [Aspergillus tanneri]|uniref:Cyclase n=1 Tax=Aspergillus tanneri TaxID=1220188 RepID=A0A5M9MIF9_9EURO|nr:uncharacterized protein ATNIH1004_005467 [Aspergillus tanneri]KAA8646792.1 hypothetical protein ATNIH1004_005467 [Aspergillus tanneri]